MAVRGPSSRFSSVRSERARFDPAFRQQVPWQRRATASPRRGIPGPHPPTHRLHRFPSSRAAPPLSASQPAAAGEGQPPEGCPLRLATRPGRRWKREGLRGAPPAAGLWLRRAGGRHGRGREEERARRRTHLAVRRRRRLTGTAHAPAGGTSAHRSPAGRPCRALARACVRHFPDVREGGRGSWFGLRGGRCGGGSRRRLPPGCPVNALVLGSAWAPLGLLGTARRAPRAGCPAGGDAEVTRATVELLPELHVLTCSALTSGDCPVKGSGKEGHDLVVANSGQGSKNKRC